MRRTLQIDRRGVLAGVGGGAAALLAGCAAPTMRAAPGAASTQRWPQTARFVERFVAEQPIPGALVALGRRGEPASYVADGTIALDSMVAVDEHTLWRVYSMTKPVTGIAAMLLVEDGALGLDQPIADLLPEFAGMTVLTYPENSLDARPAAGPITVRHLLTHTAGLGYTIVTQGPLLEEYRRLGLLPFATGSIEIEDQIPAPGEENRPASLAEFSRRLASLPLIADPGAKWSYSVSLDLLGRVIEVAAGMPFEAFLRRRLFDPLGMHDTVFTVPADRIGRLSTGYGIDDDGIRPIDPAATSVFARPPAFPYGGAGLVTSARDYDRFLAMLLGEGAVDGVRIMAAETARRAMSDLLPAGADTSALRGPLGFGAGGSVTREDGPAGGAGTFGWGGAAGTIAWVDRAHGLRVSGYVQHIPSNATPFRAGVTEAVYVDLAARRADG